MNIAGVDEAGRGPLAGPVVAAAVILNPAQPIQGLKDSKALTASMRERLYEQIKTHALAYGIGMATPQEIDELNILQATLLAMQRAVSQLTLTPTEIWVDGRDKPRVTMPVKTFIKGDALHEVISAASILAKVTRDADMLNYAKQFPEYHFEKHKGYPTVAHIEAIKQHGVLSIHRRSFGPVKQYLLEETIGN